MYENSLVNYQAKYYFIAKVTQVPYDSNAVSNINKSESSTEAHYNRSK